MKVSLFFALYDFWIGGFWDGKKHILYICLLPCIVLKIEKKPKVEKLQKIEVTKTFVLAKNHYQADTYIELQKLNRRSCYYVGSKNQLLGYNKGRIIILREAFLHPDYSEIMEYIDYKKMCGQDFTIEYGDF